MQSPMIDSNGEQSIHSVEWDEIEAFKKFVPSKNFNPRTRVECDLTT